MNCKIIVWTWSWLDIQGNKTNDIRYTCASAENDCNSKYFICICQWFSQCFGCILSTSTTGSHKLDFHYQLQAVSKAFFAERNILCNKAVSLAKGLIFFNGTVTPVACFAAGRRKVCKTDLGITTFAVGLFDQNWWVPHEILSARNVLVMMCVQ